MFWASDYGNLGDISLKKQWEILICLLFTFSHTIRLDKGFLVATLKPEIGRNKLSYQMSSSLKVTWNMTNIQKELLQSPHPVFLLWDGANNPFWLIWCRYS